MGVGSVRLVQRVNSIDLNQKFKKVKKNGIAKVAYNSIGRKTKNNFKKNKWTFFCRGQIKRDIIVTATKNDTVVKNKKRRKYTENEINII